MLNISPNSINKFVRREKLASLQTVEAKRSGKVLLKLLTWTFSILFLIMFIPWTQNIQSRGYVTTLEPEQRPQTIHSIIAGRIEKWYVREGDFVRKGDTILFISEIKDDYFDPKLLERTQQQLKAKEMSVGSYMEKIRALDNQVDALVQTGGLKFEQAQNKLKQANLKVISDSMDFQASKINYDIAIEQFQRMEQLYKEGLKSLTDLENRKLTMQRTQAQMISAENKLLTSRNEVINAKVELTSIQAQYRNSVAKAESDKFTAMSDMYDAEAVVTKLQNQYMNYSVRTGYYYITAPQDGYVTKAIQVGLGETIKEGEEIVSIMPYVYQLAVEMYIRPIDLPLVKVNKRVRIQFDGWPAIVFSGWPNTSYGTYGGRIFAIDNFISTNGHYRILVQPDPLDHPWPEELRVGAGTYNMMLLNDVPIWYELWRQINGFPPDYYQGNTHLDDTGIKPKK
jgi:membrane fusion protein, adhesin transport system